MANKNTNNINNKPKSNKTKTTQQASPKGTPGAKKQIGATIAAGTAARTSKTIIIVSIIASVALVLLSILGIFAVSGASFGKNAKEINYLRANLNRYISFPDGAYKNIEVDIHAATAVECHHMVAGSKRNALFRHFGIIIPTSRFSGNISSHIHTVEGQRESS